MRLPVKGPGVRAFVAAAAIGAVKGAELWGTGWVRARVGAVAGTGAGEVGAGCFRAVGAIGGRVEAEGATVRPIGACLAGSAFAADAVVVAGRAPATGTRPGAVLCLGCAAVTGPAPWATCRDAAGLCARREAIACVAGQARASSIRLASARANERVMPFPALPRRSRACLGRKDGQFSLRAAPAVKRSRSHHR